MPRFDQSFHALANSSRFVEFLHAHNTPEWASAFILLIQALILLIQAFIFWRQTNILREHGESLGKSVEIADAQKCISDQQKTILDEQLKFQKRVETKAERTRLFDLVLDVKTKLQALKSTTETAGYSEAADAQIRAAWDSLGGTIIPCTKALLTSIQIPPVERDYFLAYVTAVDAIKPTFNRSRDAQQIKSIDDAYSDFGQRMLKAARTPTDD